MELSRSQRARLKSLCLTIHQGLSTFLEVGNALRLLRDERLYVEGHKTFESFMKAEFGLPKSVGYQYIQASEAREAMSAIADKTALPELEAHYREIVKAPADKMPEVLHRVTERVKEEGRKPTSKDYKAAVAEVKAAAAKVLEAGPVNKPEPPKEDTEAIAKDQAKANLKLARDYIAKSVNAVDDYHAVNPNAGQRRDVVKLLQKAGENLW